MSYHVNKNAGQRSTGIIFVVVFHILIIWGLASGLANKVADKLPEILQTKVVEEEKKTEEVEPPPPPPPEKAPPPDFVPPPEVSYASDAPTHAITQVQNKVVTPPPVAMTKPRPAGRGLSAPEYPSASVRLGEQGVTGLNLYITEEGKVADAKVVTSSGFERLDEAAVKHSMRYWKFIPCMQGDKPVACWHAINYRWKIEDARR